MPETPETQAKIAIQQIVADLYRIDDRLAEVVASLPTPEEHFDRLAELRACVETVRSDLLTDAIETLHIAATSTQALARQRWLARQRCMAAVIG